MAGCIVVGIGGDGSGASAARTAAHVAGLMNVPVVLVFGYEASSLAPRGGVFEEQLEAIGRSALDDVRAMLASSHPDVEVETELVADRAVDALISVASARGAEAIAVGHGGSGPLRAALLGSITYEMVHRAPLPVLVVPDEDNED